MRPIFTRSQKAVSPQPDSVAIEPSCTRSDVPIRGDKRIAVIIGLIALLLNHVLWVKPHFGGFEYMKIQTAEQMRIAAAARNASEGLLSMDSVVQANVAIASKALRQPYAEHGLFSWLLGLVFRFTDATDFWGLFSIWFCYGLWLALGYLYSRLSLPRLWSAAVVVLAAIAPMAIRNSTSLVPDLPATVLVLIFFLCLVRGVSLGILGFLFGLVCWLKPGFFPLLLPAVWLCCKVSGKPNLKSNIVPFVVGWLCAVLPLLIRNILAVGNPFHEMFHLNWGALPLLIPCLVFLVQTGFGFRQHKVGFIRKTLSHAIICVYVVVCLVNFPPIVGANEDDARLDAALVDFLEDQVAPKQLLVSDAAAAIAWQCGRTTVQLPANEGEMRALNALFSVDAIFVLQGASSPLLPALRQGGWFGLHYYPINSPESSAALLFLNRSLAAPGQSVSQLLHGGTKLFLFNGKEILRVNAESEKEETSIECPPDIVRARMNSITGAFHLLTSRGQIWTLGQSIAIPSLPEMGTIVDFAVTPSGNGCLFVMDDGNMGAVGDAADFPSLPAVPVPAPRRVEITHTGRGCYVLGAFGQVAAIGDATPGYNPSFYPLELAVDLALPAGKEGYYVLDAYGGIHGSSPDLPVLSTRYDDREQWAVDLEILSNGTAYVLSKDGMIYHCKSTNPSE